MIPKQFQALWTYLHEIVDLRLEALYYNDEQRAAFLKKLELEWRLTADGKQKLPPSATPHFVENLYLYMIHQFADAVLLVTDDEVTAPALYQKILELCQISPYVATEFVKQFVAYEYEVFTQEELRQRGQYQLALTIKKDLERLEKVNRIGKLSLHKGRKG